jgi:hypothetical protein
LVGPNKHPMNVILDTGSSALALDGHKYKPDTQHGDHSTNLAQTDSYGDGSSWTGSVFKMAIAIGDDDASVTVADADAAIAYQQSANMFRSADGILGLAYAPLDDAFQMPKDTWKHKYSSTEVRAGQRVNLVPYLTQLADEKVTSDIIAFVTRRSFIHEGGGGATDPLNTGWMLVGGGEKAKDLYSGTFQTVKVVSDDWWSTVLKSVVVGDSDPIAARIQGPKGMASNSIVDSGTNSLNISPQLLSAILSKFTPTQQSLLQRAIHQEELIAVADLDLASWPDITFVLEGADPGVDVALKVSPSDYWQVNTEKVGAAMAAITEGEAGLTILGLPIMNGYFTIFDGEAADGKGVIKFATVVPLP